MRPCDVGRALDSPGVCTIIHTAGDDLADAFEWDDENESHIQRHDLYPDEVEAAFYNDPMPTPAYNRLDERRYGLIGATDEGRILTVIYTHRAGRIRVVTARDASDIEKRRYRRT